MAYDSRVYRILIASPSDVEEEREIAVRVIQEWNDLYSYTKNVTLLPLRWETHTAPEYGTRPQEIINRAIVDQCDLLLGIFWTRIGSPTGLADSGTLEEIERVGKAGKPIMLYFSGVGIDPNNVDLDQMERLKQFRTRISPIALTGNYKSTMDFRDRLVRDIELKARELQIVDERGDVPLSIEFLSPESGAPIGNHLSQALSYPVVNHLDIAPKEDRERVAHLIATVTKATSYVPLPLVIKNSSTVGIRNLYVELETFATSDHTDISDSPWDVPGTFITRSALSAWTQIAFSASSRRKPIRPEVSQRVKWNLAEFESDEFQKTDKGWRLTFEWEALQPQRRRLIKPILCTHSPESTTISYKAKVFADSFPEPLILEADVNIDVTQNFLGLEELLPNRRKLVEEEKSGF
jgi:hypothetical protein